MKTFFHFTLLVCMLSSTAVFAQNPGNIGVANLTAWFKPDALPLGNVTAWSTTLSTLGVITVTDPTAPYPQATNTPAGNVSNYNTTLYFNNNSTTNLQGLSNAASINLLQNNTTTGQGTFFCAYYFPGGGGNNNHMMLWNNTPHAIQLRNLGANGRLGIGLSASNSVNACRNWTEGNLPTVVSAFGNRSTATSLNLFDNDLFTTNTTASQSSGPTGLYLGYFPGNVTAPYNGYLHEYIFYNTNLNPIQMRRVHSYLAIKYGVTLDLTGGGVQGDYTSTTDQVLWDASVTPAYHNNVIGIGRDDAQLLLQKQSHAFDDNYRLYINTLAANNVSNLGVITNDVSYVMMGQNMDGACGTAASNAEAPTWVNSRLAREWKVTNTNFNQLFNWDVKIDTCQIAGSTVGAVNPANFYLLFDDDGDFTNATTAQGGTGSFYFTYNSGYVTVHGISNLVLPVNSTRYFTLGYNAPSITLNTDATICNGDSVQLTVNMNITGPINVTYSDGTSSFVLNNVSDGYTFYVSPTTTTTYSVINASNFFNCCGGSTSSSATITVNPTPIVTANASLNPICVGDSTQLTGGGASTYVWNNGVINGNYVSPIANTVYTVIGTGPNGCIDTANVNVVVNATPSVGATADQTTICFGDSVILNGTGATTYTWNNGATDNVYFFPGSTTTYTVTGFNGICSDTASIQIIVNPLPPVVANASSTAICLNDSVVVFGAGATTFTWNNGVTDNVYFSPSATTMYTVTGTDGNGCINYDSISVVVNSLPNVTGNANPAIICEGDSSQLTGSGANTYTWDNGIVDGAYALPVITTVYTVIGADINGCLDTNTVTVTVNPNPNVTASADAYTLCIGDPVTVTGAGATSYVWTNGVTDNVSFNPSSTATYVVTGTDGNGCTDTASVQIVVNNLPNVVANASVPGVCEGDPMTLFGTGATSYTWDNGVTNNVPFVPTSALNYTVTGTDNNNCVNTDNVFVDFYPAVPFALGPDTTVCPQEPINLFANGTFNSYSWSNGSSAPTITVNTNGVFVLTVTDVNGCEYTDNQIITVGEDCFVTLFVPNAFTPDGDEFNRYFRTSGSYIKFFQIQIFNRWGELMFESNDIDSHWDGTYGGKICQQGIYTYTIRYAHDLNTDEKLVKTGHVNLLR